MGRIWNYLEEWIEAPMEWGARKQQERFYRLREEQKQELAIRRRQPHQWRVAFREGNKIAEFYNGKRRHTLTFPQEGGRNAYMEGDLILFNEFQQSQVNKIFPELAQKRDGFSLFELLAFCLGVEEKTFKTGYRIEAIMPHQAEYGTGRAFLRGIVLIPGLNQAITIKSERSSFWVNRDELSALFEHNDKSPGLVIWENISQIIVENLPISALTGGSSALRWIFRRAARRVLSRIRNRLLRKWIGFLVKEFPKKFIPKLFQNLVEKTFELKQRIELAPRLGQPAPEASIARIVTDAIQKATLDALEEVLVMGIMKKFKEAMKALYPYDPSTEIKKKLFTYIFSKILELNIHVRKAIIEECLEYVKEKNSPQKSSLMKRLHERAGKDLSPANLWEKVFKELGNLVPGVE